MWKLWALFGGIVLGSFWLSLGITVLTFGWPEDGWGDVRMAGLISLVCVGAGGALGFLVCKVSKRI